MLVIILHLCTCFLLFRNSEHFQFVFFTLYYSFHNFYFTNMISFFSLQLFTINKWANVVKRLNKIFAISKKLNLQLWQKFALTLNFIWCYKISSRRCNMKGNITAVGPSRELWSKKVNYIIRFKCDYERSISTNDIFVENLRGCPRYDMHIIVANYRQMFCLSYNI